MSLYGMSWLEAIAVTLGIAGWTVLCCLFAEFLESRTSRSGRASIAEKQPTEPSSVERKRAA